MVGPQWFYPPYPNGLVVSATLDFWQFFSFFPNFWAEFSPFIEKKRGFLLRDQGGLPSLPS